MCLLRRESAVEWNSTYSWNLELPNIQMNTFDRKQHYNVPSAVKEVL